jgi:hypothetical protein
MAEGLDLSEILRRTAQANARFYKGWLDLSLEYFRGISEIFGGIEAPAPAAAGEPDPGVLVLEAEEGAAAQGAFLVTNDLGRPLTCELVASDFTDADGHKFRAKAAFEPAVVQLEPGEQRVVRAELPVEGKLAAGVAYSGAFGIKGMDGFSVPVVLRRLHRVEETPAAEARVAEETGGKASPARARRKPAAGRGAAKTAGAPKAGANKRVRREPAR